MGKIPTAIVLFIFCQSPQVIAASDAIESDWGWWDSAKAWFADDALKSQPVDAYVPNLGCEIGERREFKGCRVDVTAQDDQDNMQSTCTWNAPQGWVIEELVRIDESSINNGGIQHSLIAGESRFVSTEEIKTLFDMAASKAKEDGNEKAFNELKSRYESVLSRARSIEATHQTIEMVATASGHGKGILGDSKGRGWAKGTAIVRAVCAGAL